MRYLNFFQEENGREIRNVWNNDLEACEGGKALSLVYFTWHLICHTCIYANFN